MSKYSSIERDAHENATGYHDEMPESALKPLARPSSFEPTNVGEIEVGTRDNEEKSLLFASCRSCTADVGAGVVLVATCRHGDVEIRQICSIRCV